MVVTLPGIASCYWADFLLERAKTHKKSWNYNNGGFYRCNFRLFRQSFQIQIVIKLHLCVRKHFNHVRSFASGDKIMIYSHFLRCFDCGVVISKGLTGVNRYNIKFHVWSAVQSPFRGGLVLHHH